MGGTESFGYFLIAVSAVLLAQHWQQRIDLAAAQARPVRDSLRRQYLRRQLQRRSVASALIGVIGAAMTMVDRVPHNPLSLSAYLFGLVLGGVVILAIALADLHAGRRYRESQHLELLTQELHKATTARAESE